MLDYIELGNIRIFEGEGWKFPLAPLTVFCGTNSSGKSTILKTLLLLNQNVWVDKTHDRNFIKNYGHLKFAGNQIDLGNYESFVSNNDINLDITLGFGFNGWVNDNSKTIRNPEDSPDANFREITFLTPSYPYEFKASYKYGLLPSFLLLFDESYELEQSNNLDDYSAFPISRMSPILKEAKFEVNVGQKFKLEWGVYLNPLISKEVIYKAYIKDQQWEHELLSQLFADNVNIQFDSNDYELEAFMDGFFIESFYFTPKRSLLQHPISKRGLIYPVSWPSQDLFTSLRACLKIELGS